MIFVRRSIYSGIIRTREINVTEEQLIAWNNGMLIQLAMPDISNEEREFILTGITGEEWDEMYAEEFNHSYEGEDA